jgi:hypothetical protein
MTVSDTPTVDTIADAPSRDAVPSSRQLVSSAESRSQHTGSIGSVSSKQRKKVILSALNDARHIFDNFSKDTALDVDLRDVLRQALEHISSPSDWLTKDEMLRTVRDLGASTTQTSKDKIKNVLKSRIRFILQE